MTVIDIPIVFLLGITSGWPARYCPGWVAGRVTGSGGGSVEAASSRRWLAMYGYSALQ